ncbi:MAG: LysM peptidoglycan-binding domain-containing protein [Deltaproteobacteria bacterium]|nr:LysM peptidoglycan-binding domain-containing protein [Deltaproteobacteria bacterium]
MRNTDLARGVARQTSRDASGNRREPLIYIAGGLVLLAILLVVFIGKTGNSPREDRYADLEGRIKRIEQKLVRIEMMDLRISQLEAKVTEFNVLIMDKMERVEKGLVRDRTSAEKQEAKPKLAEARAKAEAAPTPRNESEKAKAAAAAPPRETPAKAKETLYHEVQTGETLYRISRTYGLSVDELMRMNNLAPGDPIRQGQRLRVGAVEGR